jgi:flagellar assembly protein FliH
MSSSKILKGDQAKSSPYSIREMESQGKKSGRKRDLVPNQESALRTNRESKETVEMEAYNLGLQKGQEEGRKMALKKAEPLFDTLKKAIDELTNARSAMLDRHREQMLEILILIAEKVIHRQVQISPDIIMDTVRAASSHLMETEEIRVRLHPSDFEYIREIEDALAKKLTNRKNVTIVEDSSMGRGGVVIETEFGDIDATIRSQIEHLKDVLFDHA